MCGGRATGSLLRQLLVGFVVEQKLLTGFTGIFVCVGSRCWLRRLLLTGLKSAVPSPVHLEGVEEAPSLPDKSLLLALRRTFSCFCSVWIFAGSRNPQNFRLERAEEEAKQQRRARA